MINFVPNPNLEREILHDLDGHIGKAAWAGAEELDRHLTRGSRSGRKYAKYQFRSSAKGEYPQEQTGDLRYSVGAERLSVGSWAMGFLQVDDPRKVLVLEFGGDNPLAQKAQRRPLYHTFEGRDVDETLERMSEAISDANIV